MDNLDCCNICEKKIAVSDEVIVTCDAEMIEEPNTGMFGYSAVFELPDNRNYRGVYCPECWAELMGLEYKLWEKKGKERAKASPTGNAPSKMAMFGGQFQADLDSTHQPT